MSREWLRHALHTVCCVPVGRERLVGKDCCAAAGALLVLMLLAWLPLWIV